MRKAIVTLSVLVFLVVAGFFALNYFNLQKETKLPEKPLMLGVITVEVYFNNNQKDPQSFNPEKVYPVEREIPYTQAVAKSALEELLKGPALSEQTQGYCTNINPGVKIQSLVVQNGVAKVDFDATLEAQVGGSARVQAIRAQITETLKQFPTIEQVIISVNGRTDDVLQP